MILENNEELDGYNDTTEGQTILVPSDYCERMVLYVDQQRNVPTMFKIFDHKGLYEQYEFKNLNIDPSVQPGEFTENFAEYGF